MGGLGFIIGGALQGAGAGMAQAQAIKDQERRDAALAKLRRDENSAQNVEQADLNDRNAARSDERGVSGKLTILGKTQEYEAKAATAAAEFKKQENETQRDFEIRKTRLESALRKDENTAKIVEEAKQRGLEPFDVVTDGETGAVSVIYKNGKGEIVNGVVARPKPGTSSDSSEPVSVGATRGGGAAKPTAAAQNAKTITRAQIAETAKATGMSEQQAIADAQRRGYTVK